jgi:hypothetical protein
MFKDLLDDGEGKTLETWNTIFRHLSDRAKDAETPLRGGRTTDDVEDWGLVKFYMALKTPGRVALNSLNSPRRVRYNDGGMDEDGDGERESPAFGASSATKDARFDHLRTSLALAKGELGTRALEAPYATIHGGLQGAFTALATFEEQLDSKASSVRVDGLVTGTNACYDKSVEACRAVEQLVTLGSISKVVTLEHELRNMIARTRVLETTLDRASKLVEDLSAYVANLAGPGSGVAASGDGVAAKEYLAFKASQEHAMASIHQELKGGGITLGGVEFDGKDACIAFAREHLTGDLTYHCIPSLMYARCMTSEEVVYKSDMQSDKIHAAWTAHNPMQSAVVLSVNTIIPPVLEGKKDGIRELKHDFNAAKTYEEWLPQNSHGGACRNLQGGVKRAFERIKGAISQSIGSRLALTILTELHGECMMHFSAIFITEVVGFYRDILGKSGAPPQSAASKVSCWSLVTKLLRVLFKYIHKMRVEAVGLENDIRDDAAWVNGSSLYAALEELRVLREFHEHEYRQHPKFHHNVTDGAGHNTLKLTWLENAVADHGTSIDRLEMAVGTMRQGLGLPATGSRHKHGGASKGVTLAETVDTIK